MANDDVIELYMPLKTVVWPFVIVNIIEMIFKGLWDAKLDACVYVVSFTCYRFSELNECNDLKK